MTLIEEARREASALQGARIRNIRVADKRRVVALLRKLAGRLEDEARANSWLGERKDFT